MAAIDQPTPPNLGNQSLAQFLNLPDWSVLATNQTAEDGSELPDTFTAMQLCVIALFYRLVRDNFAYENEAWSCRQSTPLLEKIQALEGQLQSRPTDNLGQALTITLLQTFALPLPTLLFSGNGSVLDPISGTVNLINVDPPGTPHAVFHVVNARGGLAVPGDVTYGLRATKNRYYYTDVSVPQFLSKSFMASCNVVPQWPEDSSASSKIVLLKLARYDVADETGSLSRLAFEFALSKAPVSDDASHGTDLVLSLRYFNSGDVEQYFYAFVGSEAVGIGLGREITLGFSVLTGGSTSFVQFYVNAIKVGGWVEVAAPDPGTSANMRLHVGADQFGDNWCGGPINNVYYDGNPGTQSTVDSTIHGVYRVGAGYLTP